MLINVGWLLCIACVPFVVCYVLCVVCLCAVRCLLCGVRCMLVVVCCVCSLLIARGWALLFFLCVLSVRHCMLLMVLA